MYYADAVAALDKVVYHYDQSNENSYMSQGWKSLNVKLEKDKQDIIAVRMVRDFFLNKEEVYRKPAEESVVYHLRELMREACRANNKDLFLSATKNLAQVDTRYASNFVRSLQLFSKISPSLLWRIKRLRLRFLE